MRGFDTEWLAVAAPFAGAVVNFVSQVGLARSGVVRSLVRAIAAAAAFGAVVATILAGAFLFLTPLPLLDGAAIAVSALTVYGGAAFLLFALVNLGETSLRIRLIERLMARPGGMTSGELLAILPDTNLIEERVRRMKVQGQIRATNSRLYPTLSLLFASAVFIGFLRRLLYGRR
jgi:hypothetical protein